MPTPKEQLETIRDQVLARIVEVTASQKPSYSEEGQTYNWADYLAKLNKTLKDTNDEIERIESREEIFEYQQAGQT